MLAELLRRSSWLTLGAVTGRFLPLAVLLLASRWMDPRQFASASAGFAWAGVGMSLTSMGLSTVMTQRLSASGDRAELPRLFAHHLRISLVLGLLLAAAVVLFGKPLSSRIFASALDPVVVLPAALCGALWSQVVVCVAALNGCHRVRSASATLAVCGMLQGAGMAAALVLVGPEARFLAWGLFLGNLLACGVASAQMRRLFGRDIDLRQLWRARPALGRSPVWRNPVAWNTLASACTMPVSFFAGSLISHGPDGTHQLAKYFALEQVYQMLTYLPAIVGTALLPVISRRMGSHGDRASQSSLLSRLAIAALVAAGVALLLGFGLTIEPDWLIQLLRSRALDATDGDALRWMVLTAALATSLSITGGAYLGAGRIVAAGLFNVGWSALFLGLTAALAAQGNAGLQLARLAATLALIAAATSVLFWLSRRHARG